jgi:malate synthase
MATPLSSRTEGKGDLTILGRTTPEQAAVLTPPALQFVARLAREFGPRILERMQARRARQARFDRGERPDFLPETREIRESEWKAAPLPAVLDDRRVEITGPVDRKMIINALNSGANVFMADFEDSTAPTWSNLVSGQANLIDAVRGTIEWTAPDSGKTYRLGQRTATLFVRPRGLHLPESHVTLGGQPIPGALFDFGIYLFHNARALLERGVGPYFYVPKLESHLEARIWNDVFNRSEDELGLPRGSIRATVLIETLPAAFEMNEILYELREHSAGLNCGRWDYIFSFIKTVRGDPRAVLPDRAQLTMDGGFLHPYSRLLIETCHRRGVHAMGGMAAQIPRKDDTEANQLAMDKVRADKLREVKDGHDGTWVAHPGLVALAREIFDAHMPGKNQIQQKRPPSGVTRQDLLTIPEGSRTAAGLRHNIRVGLTYLESWLRGIGCVPIYHLMEDAATSEICRSQVWQWQRYGATLDDGTVVTPALVHDLIEQEQKGLVVVDETFRRFSEARELFEKLCTSEQLENFMTLPAYDQLKASDRA